MNRAEQATKTREIKSKIEAIFNNQQTAYRHGIHELWRGVIEYWFLKLIKQYDIPYKRDINKQLKDIEDKFDTSELYEIIQLLAKFILYKPFSDGLGEIFMCLNLGKSQIGQYFTPPDISELCSGMILNKKQIDQQLEKSTYLKTEDPACGSGAILLENISRFVKVSGHPQHFLYCVGQDIDQLAAMMCYIQFIFFSINGTVILGNSLTNEIELTLDTPIRLEIKKAIMLGLPKAEIYYKNFDKALF